jgi:hypothetical protein
MYGESEGIVGYSDNQMWDRINSAKSIGINYMEI